LGVLYVVSAEEAAGKTAICAGLGSLLQSSGKKVGYLKPLAGEKGGADGDIAFMRQVLGLSGDADKGEASQDKDVVLVEGMVGPSADDAVSQTIYGAAREMSARVIAVAVYSGQPSKYIESYQGFGESLLGVVLNKVPQSQLKRVQGEASKQFGAAGIKVLGVIPEDRVLLALTVGELADAIQGKIRNSAEKSAELVENFMLGAMVVDSGLDYFGRKSQKAAIVRQNRPDMQLAALETSTRCLVLSAGSEPPIYSVLEKAENRGIPIVSTETATGDIVTGIEEALRKSRFHQEKKLSKLTEIMRQNLDLKAIA
jgi:BioD-like phosphotransacetylase family protein